MSESISVEWVRELPEDERADARAILYRTVIAAMGESGGPQLELAREVLKAEEPEVRPRVLDRT